MYVSIILENSYNMKNIFAPNLRWSLLLKTGTLEYAQGGMNSIFNLIAFNLEYAQGGMNSIFNLITFKIN